MHPRSCPERPFIVEKDDALVIVDKPAGLPSVPGRAPGLQDCAVSRVQAHHPDARVVHRLDMATSGLLLLARGPAAQRALSAQFERREVDKTYVAWVSGLVRGETGTIDAPLRADWPQRPRQLVDSVAGKSAVTGWRVLKRDENKAITRLELKPLTGRSHQLRVHLLSIGHPIVGDALYAPEEVAAATSRLLLHASELAVRHPLTGQRVAWRSEPDF
jgi:tRNA pseudouridine32 synthase/23S rRNA pseudouridine746 synthase